MMGESLAMSSMNSKESMDEVSKKIRGAMRERGRRRHSEDLVDGESGWEMTEADVDGEVENDAEDEPEEGKKTV